MSLDKVDAQDPMCKGTSNRDNDQYISPAAFQSPDFGGKKPWNVKVVVGSPDATKADIKAQAPARECMQHKGVQ